MGLAKSMCQKWDLNPRPQTRTRTLDQAEPSKFALESGALDRSAILTCCIGCAKINGGLHAMPAYISKFNLYSFRKGNEHDSRFQESSLRQRQIPDAAIKER
ncbi:hypothetical protein J6590_010786 [Homalodisca vitripennis]|nr:hypothetical protein J6590_010786 [Homalodisca vitripennis]